MSAATNVQLPPEMELAKPVAEGAEFRRRVGSISRQSAIYFSGTILTGIAGYFFKIYLARKLGPQLLGLYALGMSVVGFLGIFNALGLPSSAARFVAEYSTKKEFARLGGFLWRGLGLLSAGNLLLGVVVIVSGPWIAWHLYHAPGLSGYFVPFALIMLLGVLNTFLEQTMAGYREIARRTWITHFVGKPVNIVIAVVLISMGFGLSGYLVAQVASACLVLVLLGVSVWKLTPAAARRMAASMPIERKVVTFSAVAFGIAAVHFALGQADRVILGCYLDAAQVGIYAVAMTIVSFIPIGLQSVNQIFSPMIAELYASGNSILLGQLYTNLTRWVLILTIPLAFTVIAFSHSVIAFFGPRFESGAAVLTIGAVGQLFNCGVGSVGFLLLMSGHEVQLIKIQAANAVLMVVLSLVLVRPFGIIGAAYAATAAVVGTNLWALAVVHRRLKLFPYDTSYYRLLVPGGVMLIVLAALRHSAGHANASWQIAIPALCCAYAAFLGTLVLFGLRGEDRRLARMLWNKVGFFIHGMGAGA